MSIFNSVDRVREGLDYHLARHNLLVANLTHVDTPDFRPLDLKRGSVFHGTMQAALRTTAPGHIGPTGPSAAFKVTASSAPSESNDGNGVSLDREAVKIASNHVRYEVLSTLVAHQLSTLDWAASDARRT